MAGVRFLIRERSGVVQWARGASATRILILSGSFPAPPCHWFMSQRTLYLNRCSGKKPQQTGITVAILVATTLAWFVLYAWGRLDVVGRRFWAVQHVAFRRLCCQHRTRRVPRHRLARHGRPSSAGDGADALSLEQMMEMDPGDFRGVCGAKRVFNHRIHRQ